MKNTDKILKGAEELFFRYGIRSVTMDDIAKHLGISKKTIYQSFKDKDQVVMKLMQQKLEADEAQIKKDVEQSDNVVEEVFNAMKHIADVMGRVNPNVFYDLQKYHPKAWQLFHEFKEKCILKTVEVSLEKGKKQGYIRTDINSKVLAMLRIHILEMGFNPDIFPPDKFNLLEVQLGLTEHFLYGICTLRGHKLINKLKQIVEEE
jgi:AcrR family transcriptional regulator